MAFDEFVTTRFGGVLTVGTHPRDSGQACVFEAWNAYQGKSWSDSPQLAGCFDIRQLNDIPLVPDELRTRGMLLVMSAYQGSLSWPLARQIRTVERLGVLTVQRIVSELPGLPQDLRRQCASVTSLAAAQAAAQAATEAAAAVEAAVEAGPLAEATWAAATAAKAATWASEAATWAAKAAAWAPEAATWAPEAATWAAKTVAYAASAAAEAEVAALFTTACTLWLEAVKTTARSSRTALFIGRKANAILRVPPRL